MVRYGTKTVPRAPDLRTIFDSHKNKRLTKSTHGDIEMAAWLLDGLLGLGEAKVTTVIIIKNGDTGRLVLANLVLWRNAATGGQRTIVIAHTIKWLDREKMIKSYRRLDNMQRKCSSSSKTSSSMMETAISCLVTPAWRIILCEYNNVVDTKLPWSTKYPQHTRNRHQRQQSRRGSWSQQSTYDRDRGPCG